VPTKSSNTVPSALDNYAIAAPAPLRALVNPAQGVSDVDEVMSVLDATLNIQDAITDGTFTLNAEEALISRMTFGDFNPERKKPSFSLPAIPDVEKTMRRSAAVRANPSGMVKNLEGLQKNYKSLFDEAKKMWHSSSLGASQKEEYKLYINKLSEGIRRVEKELATANYYKEWLDLKAEAKQKLIDEASDEDLLTSATT